MTLGVDLRPYLLYFLCQIRNLQVDPTLSDSVLTEDQAPLCARRAALPEPQGHR